MNLVRGEFTGFEQVLDLGDRDSPCHRGERVEVAGGGVEHQVAVPITLPRTHQGVVGEDCLFEDELAVLPVDVEASGVFGR
jgi:hypothetical protein